MLLELIQKLQAIAVAEAILSPDWEYRYFSFDSKWSETEQMASMRDGSGTSWWIVFKDDLCAYKFISPNDGLIQDYSKLKKSLPSTYDWFINEPAFCIDEATSIWFWLDNAWQKHGIGIPNNYCALNRVKSWSPSDYARWASEYYETNITTDSIANIFDGQINDSIIKLLNPEMSPELLRHDLIAIGYQTKT